MKKLLILEYDENDLSEYEDNYTMCFVKKDGNLKLIKIPTTWEELVEYCKDNVLLKNNVKRLHKNNGMVDSFIEYMEIKNIIFYENGIVKNIRGKVLSSNRTIPQMWMTIKGLTEGSDVSSI